MAGTTFTEVFDQFMMLQNDYRLIALFNSSEEDFETYLTGWLIPAIRDFKKVCNQDLTYDSTTREFDLTLTYPNIVMLAQLVKKYWLEKSIDDIAQVNGLIHDRDFKRYSEAQGYSAKQERYNMEKEEISQLLIDYSLGETLTWDTLKNVNGA